MERKKDIYCKDISEGETIKIYEAYQNAVIDNKPFFKSEDDCFLLTDND